jgi:hypothetical protein
MAQWHDGTELFSLFQNSSSQILMRFKITVPPCHCAKIGSRHHHFWWGRRPAKLACFNVCLPRTRRQ